MNSLTGTIRARRTSTMREQNMGRNDALHFFASVFLIMSTANGGEFESRLIMGNGYDTEWNWSFENEKISIIEAGFFYYIR